MLVNHLFESGYGAAAGVETIRQLIHSVKDKKDIDLKVGPEQFPVRYDEARYLLSLWKANKDGGDKTADLFGDVNWVQGKLDDRDYRMGAGKLRDIDQERMKDMQRDKVLDLEEDYKGWSYSTYDEDYGDVMKTSHVATKDGKEVSIDWSPYNRMSDEQFKTWIDLGMPTRKDVDSIGPLSPEDLEQLMKTKLGTKARLAQEEKVDENPIARAVGKAVVGAVADTAVDKIKKHFMGEEKCPCCGDEIVNGKCGCGPECPHCGGKPHVKEGTWHIPDTPELVKGLNKWFKQDRPVGKNAELIQKSLGEFIGDDGLYDDLEAVAKVSPHIDGRSLVMTWINDHMPEIADAMKGEKGFVMYEGEDDEQRPPATRDYITKIIAGKITPGLDTDGEEFEDQAYLYHTSQLGRQNLLAKGGNWKAYYDAIKWWYKNTNESVNEGQYSDFEVMRAIKVAQDYHDDMTHAIDKIEAIKPGLSDHRAVKDELKKANEDKKDDITKKVDPKTKVALKKAQMKAAPFSKGDPVAAMAMGLEKDVNRLDKENDEEEADIAAQAMVDKYHTQELEQLKKMLDTLLKK